jgi:hypothetical protein
MFYIFKDGDKVVSVLLPGRTRKFVYARVRWCTRVAVSSLVVIAGLSASLEWRFKSR